MSKIKLVLILAMLLAASGCLDPATIEACGKACNNNVKSITATDCICYEPVCK